MSEMHKTAWPAGLKRTKARLSVLAVLERESGPLSAMDIAAKIEGEDGDVWLSTVYRVLEQFVNCSIVNRLTVMQSDTAVYELNRFSHKHYAVCVSCRKIVPMANCPMDAFTPKVLDEGFKIAGHNLEVYGYCGACAGEGTASFLERKEAKEL